jgi:hypothetical protein
MKHDAPVQPQRATYKDVMAFGYSFNYAKKLFSIIKATYGKKRIFKHELHKYFDDVLVSG